MIYVNFVNSTTYVRNFGTVKFLKHLFFFLPFIFHYSIFFLLQQNENFLPLVFAILNGHFCTKTDLVFLRQTIFFITFFQPSCLTTFSLVSLNLFSTRKKTTTTTIEGFSAYNCRGLSSSQQSMNFHHPFFFSCSRLYIFVQTYRCQLFN